MDRWPAALQEVFDKSVKEDRHVGRVGVDLVILVKVCEEIVHRGMPPRPVQRMAIFVQTRLAAAAGAAVHVLEHYDGAYGLLAWCKLLSVLLRRPRTAMGAGCRVRLRAGRRCADQSAIARVQVWLGRPSATCRLCVQAAILAEFY